MTEKERKTNRYEVIVMEENKNALFSIAEGKVITTLDEEGILVVRINREEVMGALDPEASAKMEEILNAAEKDDTVRVIILTGTGRGFCTGEDLAANAENGGCQTVMDHGFGGVTARVSKKPIICAANGHAIGGGLEIALSCDIIIASEKAKFGLTECKVGFIASTGGLVKLPKAISPKIASELVLTGNLINAQRAYEIGMINYVVPPEEVMPKAMEMARTIAANAPISLRLSKQIMHVALQSTAEDAQRMCDVAWDYIEKTEDGVEGPLAFVEKRKPNWKNR